MSLVQSMQLFCMADRDFYEQPDRMADTASRYDVGEVPQGWHTSAQGLWTAFHIGGSVLPEQGWKIHISTTPAQAARTLATVAGICFRSRVDFKFLRSEDALLFANGKYMPRASSGKFITVYPPDDARFAALVEEFVDALDGSPGPYILSDLRIGSGPVHVRHGAFVELWCAAPDGPVLAVRRPDGELVPDQRGPVFQVPEWVTVPEVVRPHMAARVAATDGSFPYRILRPLHFTNAGGVYLGEHRRTGEQVVLREARPHSGLDGLGTDAATRLHHEHRMLTKLDGLECVPRVHGIHRVWEHEFLVEEYIEGTNLLLTVIGKHPLRFRDPSAETVAAYVDWAEKIADGLAGALDALHARGVSFGDLHPGNVIVRPDDSVALVDFEYAGDAAAVGEHRIGAAGFVAPPEATGAEADRCALRAVWLAMLMPLAELASHDAAKAVSLESFARRRFAIGPDAGPPVPRNIATATPRGGSGEGVVKELFEGSVPLWPAVRDQLAAGIIRAATPDRHDRLFPADPNVFAEQGAGIAHGAAGVLLALHRTGANVVEEHVDWLVAAARRTDATRRQGLLDGLHGTATVLAELGRVDDALELLDRCRSVAPASMCGLFSGRAGVALSRSRFAVSTGDDTLLGEAVETARLLDALARNGRSDSIAYPRANGLTQGMAGAALLHLQLFRITGDTVHLRNCRRALQIELDACVSFDDGTVHVKSGHRHLIYLDGGSGGIAMVAKEYLRHREDPELDAFVRAVRHGCAHEFVREPGLFEGRAGLLAILHRLNGGQTPDDEVIAQVRRLAWHVVHRDGALLVPGRMLRRFSADLATGSAGVLLALHSVLDRNGSLAPLILDAVG